MASQGWARRLDDRADLLLKRRFGLGLTGWGTWTVHKQIAMSAAVAGAVGLVLVIALVASGQPGRTPLVLGPVAGTLIGAAIGALIRDGRRRR